MKMQCRICGAENVAHQGIAECVTYLKRWVASLYQLIPQGREFLRVPLSRETRLTIWVDGEFGARELAQLKRNVDAMTDIWGEMLEAERAERPDTGG